MARVRSIVSISCLLLLLLFTDSGIATRQLPSYDYGTVKVDRAAFQRLEDLRTKRDATSKFRKFTLASDQQNASSSDFLQTTGAVGGAGVNGFSPVRQEIRDLQKNYPDTWTLYLLALDKLQAANQSELLSFYQLAAFDGAGPTPGDQNNGYCTHISILFPTWHRPYLALYEQVLYNLVQSIANAYPSSERQRFTDAGANFRIPYWDWAKAPPSGQSVLPTSVTQQSVSVYGPAGTQTIANPLHSYRFNPLNTTELPDYPFNQWLNSVRYPTSDNPNASSQNNLVAAELDSSSSSFRSRLYNLFTNYANYTMFSNEAWIPSDNTQGYDSIESLHDQIHGLTGSGGHMTYIEYSSFDPIFFLHHAMIDRCFAMWQVLYPDSYVTPQTAEYSTFTMTAGTVLTETTDLTPFYQTMSGGFWNSDLARSTETFYYSYPETSNVTGGSTPSNIQNNVRAAINALYGPTSSKKRHPLRGVRDSALHAKRHSHAIDGPSTRQDASYFEWIINIRVEKAALNGPFFISFFLGNVEEPQNAFSWAADPNLVGTHAIFMAAAPMAGMNRVVTATMPLTERLQADVAAGRLSSMAPKNVRPYLKKNLSWGISTASHSVVPNSRVPSLSVDVVSAQVQPPANARTFPVWSPFTVEVSMNATT